jgi:hypothetical protein
MTREIIITPVLNGFICKVGCQQVVFESVATLVQNLEAYLKDPNTTEARFIRDAVNKMPDQPQQCMPTACDEATPIRTSDGGQRETRAVDPQPMGNTRVFNTLRQAIR